LVQAAFTLRSKIDETQIAATAVAEDLPLYTTNPDDYAGLEKLVRIVPVTCPPLPREKNPTGADPWVGK